MINIGQTTGDLYRLPEREVDRPQSAGLCASRTNRAHAHIDAAIGDDAGHRAGFPDTAFPAIGIMMRAVVQRCQEARREKSR